ncbi:hypothetical protein H1164_03735 [Thermoactinomyces daqus]|uniref:Uncharacterized protein n=1 Tax=Thermoactinomyces daqus TaxID=1329516 RepID=A0A7W1X8G9_9BACL|nr:hypothetical protein [Thermoactinomyces daqus]MBA4542012.1 hypothetical protein [Thermoactinomyces daqus]
MYIHLDKDDVFKAVLQYIGIQGQDMGKFFVSEIYFSYDCDANGYEYIDGVRIHVEPK